MLCCIRRENHAYACLCPEHSGAAPHKYSVVACAVQLVMINISDHFTRMKANGLDAGTSGRVMGCLLGQQNGRIVDISNSFEIKYELREGGVDIDEAFLTKKQEQCARTGIPADLHVSALIAHSGYQAEVSLLISTSVV